MSLLGLDVGLSGCRAVVVSTDGALLADIGRGYEHIGDARSCELDARTFWAAISVVLQEAAQMSRTDPVSGLAISSVGGAVVPLGRDGSVLSGCLLTDSAPILDAPAQLYAQLGQDTVYDITGQATARSRTLARLVAVQQDQPELYRAAWRFVLLGGLVAHLLGAGSTCDFTLAGGTLCYDMHQRAWSRDILAASGLSAVKLPPLAEAGTPIGVISGRVASELGISPRATVVLGGHDLACHALGVGATCHGMGVLHLGASVHLTPVFHTVPLFSMMLRDGLDIENHLEPDLWLADHHQQAGAAWLRWFCTEIAPIEQREASRRGVSLVRSLLDEMPEAPSPLFTHPPQDTAAPRAGTIHGLTLSTTRGELIKGMLEGVALQDALVQRHLEENGIRIERYRATGGGARMDRWAALCADVLGRPVARTETVQSAALGAAILAGLGIGAYDSLAEGVEAQVRVEREFEPDAGRHRVYAERTMALDAAGSCATA